MNRSIKLLNNRGLTLVEVLTGIAIIAFISTSVLVARAKITQQAVKSRQKLQACEIMDEILANNLLDTWSGASENTDAPLTANGTIDTDTGQWRWEMKRSIGILSKPVIADIIEVKLFAPQADDGRAILELDLPAAQLLEKDTEAEDTDEQDESET